MTWTDFLWGATELATDFLPFGGKTIKNLAKKAIGGWKDFRSGTDFDFGGLLSDIGDLKNGLAGTKAKIETQSKELRGKIDSIKSELQNQLQQQGTKLDQGIKNLDAKITTLSGEQKKQAEEQKQALQLQKEELTRNINEVERKLNSYPSIQFNLVGGDQYSVNWTNNSWKTAMQAFYRTAGNTFVNQYEFQRLLNEKVRDLGFLN